MFSTFELQQLICPLLFASETSFAEELLVRVVGCLFCFCIFLSLFSYSCRLRRNKSLIGDLPTSKTQGVFIGIVELKGVAVSRRIRYSPYTGQEFVFCQISIAEEWKRWETETYYDFYEQCYKTKQVQHSGWTSLEDIRTKAPFYLQDDTGKIRVWPEGAEMDITQSWQETVTPDSPYYNRISRPEIKDSTHRRRITETIIKPGEALYLLGESRLREDIVAPEIALDDQPRAYMISTRSEENISLFCDIDIILYHFWAFIFWCFAGLCLFPGTTLYELIPAACCAAAYLPLIFITWMYQTYASLIQLKHLTIQGKSNIDVQLKRRNDLISSMVSLVKQYCRHEKIFNNSLFSLIARC